jgi:putative transposase
LKQKYSLIFFFALGSDDEDRRVAYRTLIRESISEDDLQAIRSYIQQWRALGSNPFHAAIESPVDGAPP